MNLRSMTGFGRCEEITKDCRISVELKSVNHRYLDLAVKMPKKLNALEAEIRNLVKKYIARGKVDLYITYESYAEGSVKLRYNSEIAAEYMNYFKKMEEEFNLPNDIKVSTLARCQDVLVMEEESEDDERLWEVLQPVLEEALRNFVAAREKEGENLKKDLLEKLNEMEEIVARIEERSPQIVEEYRRKLTEKIAELLEQAAVEENRIVQEVTIYADKICTDEEIVRLKSHIKAMREKLVAGGACGRELDFIAQEMNREANTTLSKANDIIVSSDAIGLKTGIEKIREQVQNIE